MAHDKCSRRLALRQAVNGAQGFAEEFYRHFVTGLFRGDKPRTRLTATPVRGDNSRKHLIPGINTLLSMARGGVHFE